MTGLEDTMKRTIHIRRRRRLYRTIVLGFAAAALAPATALGAFVVDRPDGGARLTALGLRMNDWKQCAGRGQGHCKKIDSIASFHH